MMVMKHVTYFLGSWLVVSALPACGGSDETGVGDRAAATRDASTAAGGEVFQPPADPGAGGFWVTVSGEDLALLGYEWSNSAEAGGDPPAFVDGWSLRFDHVIITVDRLRINAEPDRDDANPLDVGSLVASAQGPWAVDVSIGGDVTGKSGSPDERTVPIAAFSAQSNGRPFDPASRYGFSYDLVSAADDAMLVNLDAEGLALYEQGKQQGWSMIFSGTR